MFASSSLMRLAACFALVGSIAASSIGVSSVPVCVDACMVSAGSQSGYSGLDVKRVCASSDFKTVFVHCVQTSCSPTDAATGEAFLNAVCSAPAEHPQVTLARRQDASTSEARTSSLQSVSQPRELTTSSATIPVSTVSQVTTEASSSTASSASHSGASTTPSASASGSSHASSSASSSDHASSTPASSSSTTASGSKSASNSQGTSTPAASSTSSSATVAVSSSSTESTSLITLPTPTPLSQASSTLTVPGTILNGASSATSPSGTSSSFSLSIPVHTETAPPTSGAARAWEVPTGVVMLVAGVLLGFAAV